MDIWAAAARTLLWGFRPCAEELGAQGAVPWDGGAGPESESAHVREEGGEGRTDTLEKLRLRRSEFRACQVHGLHFWQRTAIDWWFN